MNLHLTDEQRIALVSALETILDQSDVDSEHLTDILDRL